MAIQRPITLPAYTPSSWELRLPNYPVITNKWRSSSFPELLGSLPNGAEWRLKFENMTNAEALALLLPWRATAGGQWALSILPEALAGGVNNADFRKRLVNTTWTIANEPQKETSKNGRFNVSIDLVHELTFTSLYGPLSSFSARPSEDVLQLGLLSGLSAVASSAQYYRPVAEITGTPIVLLALSSGLTVAAASAAKVPRQIAAQVLLQLGIATELQVAAASTPLNKRVETFNAQSVASLGTVQSLAAADLPLSITKKTAQVSAQASIALNLQSGTLAAGLNPFVFRRVSEISPGPLSISVLELQLDATLLVAALNPVEIKSAGPVLLLDMQAGLADLPGPVALFLAGRIKAAQVVLPLSLPAGMDASALPASFVKAPVKQVPAESSISITLPVGLLIEGTTASLSPKSPQQLTAQLLLSLDISTAPAVVGTAARP